MTYVSLTRTKQVQWQKYGGSNTLVTGSEAYLGEVSDSGSWLQRTLVSEVMRWNPPPVFLKEYLLWRRFLEKANIHDFQMRFQEKTVRFFGPPSKMTRLQPEWTFYASLTGSQLGHLVVARTHVGRKPPSRRLMNDIRILLKTPSHRESLVEGQGIYIRGDLLLGFLSSALGYLVQRSGNTGQWLVESGHWGKSEPQLQTEGEEDDAVLEYPPLLPAKAAFVPQAISTTQSSWEAVHYDADKGKLICYQAKSGSWADLVLEKPLFRYFNRFQFSNVWRSLVVKGVRYRMPDVVFDPNFGAKE